MSNVLYQYTLDGKTYCDGDEQYIQHFLSYHEMSEQFGGYALMRDRGTDKYYLGIWGKKKVPRFRRLLRERGAQLVLVRLDAPARELVRWAKFP